MACLRAIFFDMDGVIADTEMVDHTIQIKFVEAERAARSLPVEGMDCSRLLGLSYGMLYRELWELAGRPDSIEETARRFETFDAAEREHLDYAALFRPGVTDILDFAREQGMLAAVVSSSPRTHIEEVLGACGILERFDAIVSGEEVAESKPGPAVYLETMRRLGVSFDEAVAIEDSAHGIVAARAAGLQVIGYRETRVPVDQSAATWLVDDMAGALRLLASIS